MTALPHPATLAPTPLIDSDHPEVIAFDMFLGAYAGEVDSAALPQQLLVDWVRVWPLDDAAGEEAPDDTTPPSTTQSG